MIGAVLTLLLVAAPPNLNYTVRPVPTASGTDLKIELRVATDKPLTLALPSDFYGTPDLAKGVSSFEGVEGATVAPGEKANERVVTPSSKGEALLRYTMSYLPSSRDASFGPIIDTKRFQVFACQWMLRIGDLEEKRPTEIHVRDVPPDWLFYSTQAPKALDTKADASYMDLISFVIGAGDLRHRTFKVSGKPVDIYLDKRMKTDPEKTLSAIERVVRLQRDWFKDYDQPFYVVSISKRDDNVAGVRVSNGFMCFIKNDVAELPLLNLLAHEMMHNWVPGQSHVNVPGEEDRWMWEWLDEGFAEYYARRVLLESKSITRQQYIDLFNRDLLNIADDPIRNSTYAQVLEDMNQGRFSVAHKKLSYYRGAIIAANWDARIRRFTKDKKNGDDLIRRLRTVGKGAGMTPETFYKELADFGIDAKADQERLIRNGESIKIEAGVLGPDVRYVVRDLPKYDVGFDLSASQRSKKITGVDPSGPAYTAGLRDGMDYVQTENSTRFGNAWDSQKPFVVVVRDGGTEKRIAFMALKGTQKVGQFELVR